MQLRVVTQPEEFAALQPAWSRLHRHCARPSVFLSHEWFDAAWQWRRHDSELYVICCEEEGELLGALPLMRSCDTERAARVRVLEFLSVPDTQQCDVLARENHAAPVMAAIVVELRRRQSDWDALRLRLLRADAMALTALAPLLRESRFRLEIKPTSANPWIGLHSGWEPYYASRSRRLKKAVNLAANRLEKAGTVKIDWLAPGTGSAEDVERTLEAFTEVSARSWKIRTGNSLDNAGPRAFIRRLAQHAHRRGWLSVWTLTLDQRPTATEFQLVDETNVYALRSDFDQATESLSPGSHLSRQMLETLFSRNLTRYFMGPGENPYKYRWAEGADPVHAMTVYGRSGRAYALAAWELALKPAAKRVRKWIRPDTDRGSAVDVVNDKVLGADS